MAYWNIRIFLFTVYWKNSPFQFLPQTNVNKLPFVLFREQKIYLTNKVSVFISTKHETTGFGRLGNEIKTNHLNSLIDWKCE